MLVWLITGASRGLGRELTLLACERGDAVVAGARDVLAVEDALAGEEHGLAVQLDVTSEEQVNDAVSRAIDSFGRIDVLVNNAAHGLVGAVEEASSEEIRSLFEANVFGLLAVTRAVLPVMREQRSGRILNVSSSGGFVGRAGGGIYTATKFAVEGLSEAMREELEPLGIHVVIVEPGAFRTSFNAEGSLRSSERVIADYAATAGEFRSHVKRSHGHQRGDPRRAAAAMVAVANDPRPPSRLPLGPDCFARIEDKLDAVRDDIQRSRALAMSTDFPIEDPTA